MSDINLDGTIVAMTGASVGLGRAMSLALASAGARVVLAAPGPDLLETLAAEISAKAGPGRALAVQTDITVRADCERVLEKSLSQFGGLHVLVNNARRPMAVLVFRQQEISCPSGSRIRTFGKSRYTSMSTVADYQYKHQPQRSITAPQLALRSDQGGARIRNTDLGG